MKERNPNAIAKLVKLEEWDIPHRNTRNGIIIDEKIMIAKNRSRWKKVGHLEWYPYYGLQNLVEALYDDALDEYAAEQQSKTNRKRNSVPIDHSWLKRNKITNKQELKEQKRKDKLLEDALFFQKYPQLLRFFPEFIEEIKNEMDRNNTVSNRNSTDKSKHLPA